MRAVTKNIDCPKGWESNNDFDSHRPLLYLSTQKINACFYEFGMGDGSTPLLKHFCTEGLVSVEKNKDWMDRYIDGYDPISIQVVGIGEFPCFKKNKHLIFDNDTYPLFTLNTIDTVLGNNIQKVVFVDNAPASERLLLIEKIKEDADVIIAHDTEDGAEYVYGLKEVLSTFKYRLDYQPEGKPHTTAVSNSIDVTKWITPI